MHNSYDYDVVTLGEAMLRLSTPNNERLSQARSLDVQVGGAESNVAVALASLGFKTAWLSRLPDNALGRRVLAELNAHGVDTSGVRLVPGDRMGTYFVELAVPPRPNRVVYDRANSAASRMTTADVDFGRIAQARWLHMTGITPALSASCRQLTADVLAFARERGVLISFDVNYRALLWSMDEAGRVLESLIRRLDVVFVAHRDAIALFGADENAQSAAVALRARFDCRTLVLTLGEDGALACDGGAILHAPQVHHVPQVVDRIGAGDAFDAGFIAARLWGHSVEVALAYGNVLSALKLTIPGDSALMLREELERLVGGERQMTVR